MARDEHLLYSETLRPAALRIYGWSRPTISLGCFQRFAEIGRLPADVRDLAVVRRITGGGAILHDREITYCLVVDDSLPMAGQSPTASYRLVHECWRDALADDGLHTRLAPDSFPMPSPRGGPFFCFEKPGRTDLLLDDRKLLGSSQRRIPGRVLQHGSLLLGRQFQTHPGADLGGPQTESVERWIEAFAAHLATALNLECQSREWNSEQSDDFEQRRRRYAGDEWTRRH